MISILYNSSVETTPQPLIDLTPESQKLLSELLFEGNCLEVTLEETFHLWSIWLMSQSVPFEYF